MLTRCPARRQPQPSLAARAEGKALGIGVQERVGEKHHATRIPAVPQAPGVSQLVGAFHEGALAVEVQCGGRRRVLPRPVEGGAQAGQGDKGFPPVQRGLAKDRVEAGGGAVGLGEP